jgi:hypothetical protein
LARTGLSDDQLGPRLVQPIFLGATVVDADLWPPPPAPAVPVPAWPVRRQQAPTASGRAAASCHPRIAADTALWTDDVWLVDSTPVECGRSRETAKRSALAGWPACAPWSPTITDPLESII